MFLRQCEQMQCAWDAACILERWNLIVTGEQHPLKGAGQNPCSYFGDAYSSLLGISFLFQPITSAPLTSVSAPKCMTFYRMTLG